ncbi:Hypothetical protein CINCED_3A019989 [Cinara cedri]|uniref:Leucine-rich repeat-containing protein 28 n=2 Tax=Cinara cedri TaxID=506608 RepID=A0A5E4MVN5_9HEMI|nr:Hypothetical protein CINCED_3A019989 [Cinara cedri]
MLRKIMTATFGIGQILHWNDRNLIEFPEDLKRYKDQVYQLYIKNNFIEKLPRWINSMAKLTHIYLGNNKLSSFPEELTQLIGLEVLCAPCNFITHIPPALSTLKRLTQLNLSRNMIKNVPSEIVNMQSLWLLDLSHNEIETLPEIYPEQLYLGEIYLNGNRLICVPDNLARLKNIEYLSLTHNNLLYVPAVIFREEATVKVDHNPFLNYVPLNIKADNCGTQSFLEVHKLPNITLTCNDHKLIISPKIKQIFSVRGTAVHCPSLKEFALRVLYVWKTPFSQEHIPKHLHDQLLSGPVSSCMHCLRPMFTYSYICLIKHESQTYFNIQYFCSKPCYGALKQFLQIRYQNEIILQEMDFTTKPYGYLPP